MRQRSNENVSLIRRNYYCYKSRKHGLATVIRLSNFCLLAVSFIRRSNFDLARRYTYIYTYMCIYKAFLCVSLGRSPFLSFFALSERIQIPARLIKKKVVAYTCDSCNLDSMLQPHLSSFNFYIYRHLPSSLSFHRDYGERYRQLFCYPYLENDRKLDASSIAIRKLFVERDTDTPRCN